MATIESFIANNVGRPNMTPKALIMEAYEMGVAHGKGEEYEAPEPVEVVEEVVIEEEKEEELNEDMEDEAMSEEDEEKEE